MEVRDEKIEVEDCRQTYFHKMHMYALNWSFVYMLVSEISKS